MITVNRDLKPGRRKTRLGNANEHNELKASDLSENTSIPHINMLLLQTRGLYLCDQETR